MSQCFFPLRRGWPQRHRMPALIIVTLLALLTSGHLVYGQTFTSGSTGADGVLTLTTPGTVVFDPTTFNPPLDPDGDNVYHFITITIGAGVTVRLIATYVNGPLFWLASGDVRIDGIIDLNGQDAQSASDIATNSRFPAVPGAGGFGGGNGGVHVSLSDPRTPTPGNGPGGGGVGVKTPGGGTPGGSAGHVFTGGGFVSVSGSAYGNNFLTPLTGGSGGGGGPAAAVTSGGGGGGAGGGALLIASSTLIAINGRLQAQGGSGGAPTLDGVAGGGGSGGAVHLLAPLVSGAGVLRVDGGAAGAPFQSIFGSIGRIRIGAFQNTFTGSATRAIFSTPLGFFLPPIPPPLIRVVSVTDAEGVKPVLSTPTGSFTMPDVTINGAAAVTVTIEARSVPPGTVVQLHLFPSNGPDQVVNSTPLTGTLTFSAATVSVTIPPGFSRGFVRATWSP